MNKSPVTQTMVASQIAAVNQTTGCRTSQPSAPGTLGRGGGPEANLGGGSHLTSNFRSDHSGGANFLMADGSVHFINEDINMLTFQQFSTIAGGEIAELPQ